MACAQQRQIDANSSELDERRRMIAIVQTATNKTTSDGISIQLTDYRQQIQRDENELQQLSAIQRQHRQLCQLNQKQRHELNHLEDVYAQDDKKMRLAVEKVEGLQKQVKFNK